MSACGLLREFVCGRLGVEEVQTDNKTKLKDQQLPLVSSLYSICQSMLCLLTGAENRNSVCGGLFQFPSSSPLHRLLIVAQVEHMAVLPSGGTTSKTESFSCSLSPINTGFMMDLKSLAMVNWSIIDIVQLSNPILSCQTKGGWLKGSRESRDIFYSHRQESLIYLISPSSQGVIVLLFDVMIRARRIQAVHVTCWFLPSISTCLSSQKQRMVSTFSRCR